MTRMAGSRRSFLFCEACGIKVRTHHEGCPRCGGSLVDGRAREVALASAREQARNAREVRLPVLVGLMAVVVGGGGVIYGLAKGASMPPVEPVSLGRLIRESSAQPKAAPPSEAIDLQQVSPDEEGNRAFSRGEFQNALDFYQRKLIEFPDDLTALNNAGQALVRLGRPVEAIPLLERAVEISPQSWMLRFNLARAFGGAGVWSRAAGQYALAADLMPDHYPTLFNLGLALLKTGRDRVAAEALERARAADPTQADPWLALGVSYDRLGLTGDARGAFERYLELAADDAPDRATVQRRLDSESEIT